MAWLAAALLRLELRVALRLGALIPWPWWWILAPLWLLLMATLAILAGSATLERRWRHFRGGSRTVWRRRRCSK